MTKHIDAQALADWLNRGEPVTVVDVRSADSRTEWSIPGSVHIDAYAERGELPIVDVIDLQAGADRRAVS